MKGRIYTRGSTLYVGVWVNGREERRSVAALLRKPPAEVTEEDAQLALAKLMHGLHTRTYRPASEERLTVSEVLAYYAEDLFLRGKKGVSKPHPERPGLSAFTGRYVSRIKFIDRHWGRTRVIDLTTPAIKVWATGLIGRYKHGTVANVLMVFRAAVLKAEEDGLIYRAPRMPKVQKSRPRQVFWLQAEVEALLGHLADPFDDLIRTYYLTGRRHREIRCLQWSWVTWDAMEVRIPDTKNGEDAVLPLEGEVADLFRRRWQAREYQRRDGTTGLSEYVFHIEGRLISERTVWDVFNNAKRLAGIGHKTIHDFRRTALSEFIRTGNDRKVVMKISGHRDERVFADYHIVQTADMREAFRRRQAAVVPLAQRLAQAK